MGAWLLLMAAIGFEIAATMMLKLSNGFEKPLWVAGSILAYCICFLFFAPALKVIPIGIAYAIWAGLGIAAISVIGVIAFGEMLNVYQVGFLALVVIGATGLRLTTS